MNHRDLIEGPPMVPQSADEADWLEERIAIIEHHGGARPGEAEYLARKRLAKWRQSQQSGR